MFRKAAIRGQYHGALFIPCVDRLEEQVAPTVGDRQVAAASRCELDGTPPEPLSGSLKTVVTCHPAQLVASLQGPSRGFRAALGAVSGHSGPDRAGPRPRKRPSRAGPRRRSDLFVFSAPPIKTGFRRSTGVSAASGSLPGGTVIGRWGLTGTAGPPPFIADQAANGFRAGSVRNAASEPGAVRPCIDRMQSASIRRFEQNAKTL